MHTIRLITVSLLSLQLAAQEYLVDRKLPELNPPAFPSGNFFRQFVGREVPHIELNPPLRVRDFVYGDHIELSLRAFIELVMANNTDVAITMLSTVPFRDAILRAYGPFDPTTVTTFTAQRANTPSTSVLIGANTLSQLTQPFSSTFSHTLETGLNYQVNFAATKNSDNSTFTTFNPNISSTLRFQLTQPLIRNRGAFVNRLPIMIARSRLKQNEYLLKNNLLDQILAAENIYWNAVQAREFLKVQEEGLRVSGQILTRNKRELELGAISALEIFQPEQQYANADVQVTQARYNLEQNLDQLRRQIAVDIDPDLRNMPIILTESVLPPTNDRPIDKESQVELAFRYRPDLKAKMQEIDIDDLTYKQVKNALRPQLDLTAAYTASGRGGNLIPRTGTISSPGVTGLNNGVIPGGIADALDNVFGFNFPTYLVGLTLRVPVKDRTNQANLADAIYSKRQDYLQARTIEQTIRQQVLNAVTNVESSRAGVRLAQVALDFSQKRLDAEQKRYDLGVTTIFFLIQAQQDLVTAQSNVVQQSVQYRRNQLTLLRVVGNLLEERGIGVDF